MKKCGNKGSICHLMGMSSGLDDTLVTHSSPLRSPDLSSKTVNACSFILSWLVFIYFFNPGVVSLNFMLHTVSYTSHGKEILVPHFPVGPLDSG